MRETLFENEEISALDAQYEAQKIAFAPIVFQVARTMREFGVLEALFNNDKSGLTIEELSQKTDISTYGITTLIETALSANIVRKNDGKYFITKIGYFLLKDKMTTINMDYNHYVNYLGLYNLDDSIKEGNPVGLKVFGEWETIYEGLSSLPEKVQKSWFDFDHYYSDTAFPEAVAILLKDKPNKILDIGGNTGKFSFFTASRDSDVHITIMDLPQQVKLANENIKKEGLSDRIDTLPANILDANEKIPRGYDIIWMSQFLDCFSEENIATILKKAYEAMDENASLYIMEPLWDRQRFQTSAYCIINTSPYFTALANGYSKMYNSTDFVKYIERSGLKVVEMIDDVGICQTILKCKRG